MRVLIDYQAFSIQARGGISRYVFELASRLASVPDVETVLYAGAHRSLMLREETPPQCRGRYVPYLWKTGPLRHAWNRWRTRRFARQWHPTLIHETYFRHGDSYAPATPTVLTIHDLIYFALPDLPGAAAVRRAQKAAIARAHHLICVSENTRTDLLNHLAVDPARTSVVHLGAVSPASAITVPPPNLARPYFLHVGLRHGYKNFDLLLTSFAGSAALRRDFTLLAFGGGAFTAAERARIRDLGLGAEQVQYLSGDDSLLERCYAHATALVIPSLYEGFGLPAVEAMAHGCPVVCSRRGSLPEVTGNASLLFDPEENGALEATLHTLIASPTQQTEFRQRGRERAHAFSWDRCAAETLSLYRRITT